MGKSALSRARGSYHQSAWAEACEAFALAESSTTLAAGDLDCWATAAYPAGRDEESSNAWSRAFDAYLAADEPELAVMSAFWSAFGLFQRGEMARGGGCVATGFGEPTASAMQVLVDLLGPPDPGEEYPYYGHPLRHVYWENVGLAAVFSDYDFFRDDGEEHFAAWAHGLYIGDLAGWGHGPSSLSLKTAKGIGIHSTLADLQTAYTDQVQLEAECDPEGPPTAAYVRGQVSSIRLSFQDLPLEAASRIGSMGAGAGPGC